VELVWFVLLTAGLFAALAVLRNERRRRARRAATVELTVDALGARRVLADGREERVDWDEVREVDVVRARSGPHAASGGVLMLAGDAERGCLVPLDRLDTTGVVEHLVRLPGFDTAALVAALDRPAPSRTTVWSRAGARPG